MKEIIFLRMDRGGYRNTTKSLPALSRGEIAVKLVVEVEDGVFGSPVIEQHIRIENYLQGIDVEDVRFRNPVITQAEADLIRERRLERMTEILREQGAEVTWPEEGEEE